MAYELIGTLPDQESLKHLVEKLGTLLSVGTYVTLNYDGNVTYKLCVNRNPFSHIDGYPLAVYFGAFDGKFGNDGYQRVSEVRSNVIKTIMECGGASWRREISRQYGSTTIQEE